MAAPQTDTALIKQYFGMDLAEAKAELTSKGGTTRGGVPTEGLPAADKAQLAQGIRDGSLTYPARQAEAEAA